MASDVGIRPFGYVMSMVVTIGLWLTLAPAMGAIARISNSCEAHALTACGQARPRGGWS